MNAMLTVVVASVALRCLPLAAQDILFDFDETPVHSGLPLDVSAGGITAHLSATGQGCSIQPANTLGFTPAGFAGNCIYPNSVYAADLLIGFSVALTDFSILYAPQELGCDDSATLRVTAYMDNFLVGSNTATASAPGTWPSEWLKFTSTQSFNRVVVHYAARPPTCQDWGPIFMADNLIVRAAPRPIVLTDPTKQTNGGLRFGFVYTPGQNCTVFRTTDPSLPFERWQALGAAIETSVGRYEFTDLEVSDQPSFYRVRAP